MLATQKFREKDMEDKARHSDMIRTFLRAQIIYNNGLTTIDCLVKNISSTGAKIAISESMSVPAEFDLCIPQKNKTYHARMAWRDASAIGVDFIFLETQVQQPEPEAQSDIIAARIRKLELQNAELKIRVRDLSKRLESLGQDPDLSVF
jgi:hypothetical protein